MSLTPRRELRALALPADIMRLPNLQGFLKFPGAHPVASIRLRPVDRPVVAPRFVPRDDRAKLAAAGEARVPAPVADAADEPPWPDQPDPGGCAPEPQEHADEAETPPADEDDATAPSAAAPDEPPWRGDPAPGGCEVVLEEPAGEAKTAAADVENIAAPVPVAGQWG